jgi:hypothetical protein
VLGFHVFRGIDSLSIFVDVFYALGNNSHANLRLKFRLLLRLCKIQQNFAVSFVRKNGKMSRSKVLLATSTRKRFEQICRRKNKEKKSGGSTSGHQTREKQKNHRKLFTKLIKNSFEINAKEKSSGGEVNRPSCRLMSDWELGTEWK